MKKIIEASDGVFHYQNIVNGEIFTSIEFNRETVSNDKEEPYNVYDDLISLGYKLVLIPQAEKDAHEQAQKLIKADSDFNIAMSTVLQTANQLERDTWVVQEKEARDWLADNTASAPFITTLAATRGIELSELVTRIIAKADAYSNMLATALGEKHKAEDNA